MRRISKGCSCNRIRVVPLRSSRKRTSSSKDPKRIGWSSVAEAIGIPGKAAYHRRTKGPARDHRVRYHLVEMIYYTQLIYLKPGLTDVFRRFEEGVLPLLQRHRGRMLLRW